MRDCKTWPYYFVKADPQKTPNKWAKFISETNDALAIVSRGTIEESKEYPLLQKATQKQ